MNPGISHFPSTIKRDKKNSVQSVKSKILGFHLPLLWNTPLFGTQEADGYIVEIILPNKVVCKQWSVVAADIGRHGFLIGMDIIGAGDFSICGGQFLSYAVPSFEDPIDFVKNQKDNRK